MLAEFAHAAYELVIDLDSYEGPWTHVAAFQGQSGWLRVVRATIQSEHDLLSADLVVACDERENSIPSWKAAHLTECRWNKLLPCSTEPPDMIDSLIEKEEKAFYARWQREMNADVAAVALKATIAVEQMEAWYQLQARIIARQIRTLNQERLLAISSEQRFRLRQAIIRLEAEEDDLAEEAARRRRQLRKQFAAEEEALWDRSDMLIELEPRCTVHWHGEASILHNRHEVYDRRPYRAVTRQVSKYAVVAAPANTPAPERMPSASGLDELREAKPRPSLPPKIIRRTPPNKPIAEPVSAEAKDGKGIETPSILPTGRTNAESPRPSAPSRPVPRHMMAPIAPPIAEEQHSKQAAQLIATLAPLRRWAKAREECAPPAVTKVTLVIHKRALQEEDRKLGERQGDLLVTPRQAAQLFELREELGETLDAVMRGLAWYRDLEAPVAEITDDNPIETDVDEPAASIAPEPPAISPLSPEEWQRLADQQEALLQEISRLERTLAALKAFAPRKSAYAAQLAAAREKLDKVQAELARGKGTGPSPSPPIIEPAKALPCAPCEQSVGAITWSDTSCEAVSTGAAARTARLAALGVAQRLRLGQRREVVEDKGESAR
jgi:hypothetical protein